MFPHRTLHYSLLTFIFSLLLLCSCGSHRGTVDGTSAATARKVAVSNNEGTHASADGWTLVWEEGFDTDGKLSPDDWRFEHGYVRNHEYQWYCEENAWKEDGCLVIEGRHDPDGVRYGNPDALADPTRRLRPGQVAARPQYTASSVNTRGRHEWLYGRFEVRAKIPVRSGAWPAIWTLGVERPWPVNGEIDIMEYYRRSGVPHILANACWGSDEGRPTWSTGAIPFTHFTDRDAQWADKFHVWRMDWDEDNIRLYLDDELLNEIPTSADACAHPGDFPWLGKAGDYSQRLYDAFHQPHYLLLNLAIGGDNGGEPDPADYPQRYLIDYVRVWQR